MKKKNDLNRTNGNHLPLALWECFLVFQSRWGSAKLTADFNYQLQHISIPAKGKHQFLPRDQVFLITLSLETVIITTQK